MQDFMICGMIRSGTTLVTKMLSANPTAAALPSPFMYFFKSLRDHLAVERGLLFDPRDAIAGATYPEDPRLLRGILDSRLEHPISAAERSRVAAETKRWVADTAPKLIPRLDEADGDTYRAFYAALLALARDVYGKPGAALFGTKECWCERFLPALTRLDDLRIVFLVRDPRAVVASQNSRGRGQKHPVLLLVRQWRDSVGHAYLLARSPRVRSLVVRYEDLVRDSEAWANALCEFLGIPFDPVMTDVSRFEDGRGLAWRPNTSYPERLNGISTASLDKWTHQLTPEQVRFIETLCRAEMRLWGYTCASEEAALAASHGAAVEVDREDLPEWIKPLKAAAHIGDQMRFQEEMAKEEERLAYLRGQKGGATLLAGRRVVDHFLSRQYLQALLQPSLAGSAC